MRPDKNERGWGQFSLLVLWLLVSHATSARGDFDPRAVFDGQCSACHTVGQGDSVGPDLAGVTDRRDRDWLVAFVRSSQAMIASGDLVAGDLFEQYGRQKMPDHDYTAEEIGEILAYIEAGGPGTGPVLRLAEEAVPAEIEKGRLLFLGQHTERAGAACASCHTLSETRSSGRFLGGSLVGVYSRYRDTELARSLEGVRDLPALASAGHEPLTADQSFYMRAFLRSVDERGGVDDPGLQKAYPFLGFSGGLILITACGTLRRGRS